MWTSALGGSEKRSASTSIIVSIMHARTSMRARPVVALRLLKCVFVMSSKCTKQAALNLPKSSLGKTLAETAAKIMPKHSPLKGARIGDAGSRIHFVRMNKSTIPTGKKAEKKHIRWRDGEFLFRAVVNCHSVCTISCRYSEFQCYEYPEFLGSKEGCNAECLRAHEVNSHEDKCGHSTQVWGRG